MQRAYYASSISEFCAQQPEHILGQITQQNTFDLNLAQRDAWLAQTEILKQALAPYEGKVYFEFSIPRMGRRVDAVVIIGLMILVIEFKVGATRYDAEDLDQVMDYALDLHHFHEGSHAQTLVPILVATQAPAHAMRVEALPHDVLLAPLCCNANTLAPAIAALHQRQTPPAIDAQAWEASGYKPNNICAQSKNLRGLTL